MNSDARPACGSRSRGRRERDQAEAERVDLGPDLRAGVAAVVRQRDVGGAVDHRDADADERQDGAVAAASRCGSTAAFEHQALPLPPGGRAPERRPAWRSRRICSARRLDQRGSGLPSFLAK